MPVDIGTGTTIAFATSSFVANILSINGQDMSRPSIKTSHMGTTTYDTFVPGDLSDPGSTEMTFQFDPDTQPPINGAAEVITITFPLSSGGTTAGKVVTTGFIEAWSWEDPMEELLTGTATIKWTGTPVWTAEV